VLGRPPDPFGAAAFQKDLDGGMSRQDVAAAVITSPECRQRSVAGLYQRFLHRPADPDGLRYWVGLWQQQADPSGVVAGIVGSQEYLAKRVEGTNDPPGGNQAPPGGGGGGSPSGPRPLVPMSGCSGTAPDSVPIPDCECCGGGTELIQNAQGVYDHSIAPSSSYSQAGVRYADGDLRLASTDLASAGFGIKWGFTRSWNNLYAPNSFSGFGMVVPQLPFLIQIANGNGTIVAVTSGTNARYFDLVGSTYVPHFFLQDTLSYNAGANEFLLTDTMGDKIRFYDFSAGLPTNQQGQFKSFTDPDGNVLSVTSLTPDGKAAEVQWSTTSGGSIFTESYRYTYVASGTNAGLFANVTLRRQVNGGAWTIVRQVDYGYYDGVQPYGNAGDLQTATIKDGAGNALDTKYYRYYTAADAGTIGWVHGLKYLFEPQSYARLVAAVGNPLTATDAQVAPYAEDYFEYDSMRRVTKAVVQGTGCSSCGGTGQGTFTYSYTLSGFSAGYNSWNEKTVETLPDGNQNFVYTNYAGEVMLKVFHDQASGNNWETFYKYDNAGRIILKANPSAVSGYNDSFADLLDQTQVGDYGYLRALSGLIEITDYYASTTAGETTAGGVAGYWQDTKLQQGKTGTLILQATTQYFAHSAGGSTVDPVATQTVYRNTDGTGAETTSYAYMWFSGTTQKQSVAVSLPTISATQNGPGTADVQTTYFDTYQRPIWIKDGDGFINYTAYDPATGAVVKTITDVDTTRTGDFQNLPAGWSTPAGGGLHLITQREVDGLGRTTKLTDPNGNVTYAVYNDPNHEVRVYPGWQSATNTTTGPTQDRREDRQFSTGYTETLTMSATPAVSGGRPTGGEAVSNVQTLSRRYISSGGQMVRADAYFNLTGLTYSTALYIGTAGTNYYSTLSDYDVRGRLARKQRPTGTIERTVYDSLSRVVSTWVGTNDMPASGMWSPTNNTPPSNMIQITANVYDGGGVGDSNRTQTTQFPDSVAADQRVSQYSYDWRDRQMARKDGVQGTEDATTHRPIYLSTLDNLGEVVASDRYDGDGFSVPIGSDGVPYIPAAYANRLRAHRTTAYDDQGRVYLTQTYSVDQTNGTISANSLATNFWFDHRRQPIKKAEPGGLVTKTRYDGARRVTKTYLTDGYQDVTWTDAGSVSTNNVLSQTEKQYDANGNVLFVITKDRFHDETATGELGNPTTAPKARVSYSASYYDAANRLTASVNVGTNGGSTYTRPSTVPAGSDTVLLSTFGYNAAGWVESVTDPRAIVTKSFYDNLQRKVKVIQAYTDGTPTNSTNRTTEYTYDGSNHTLTQQADLPGGQFETTQFVYGVSTANGSDINSNELLAMVKYPDKTTGAPSSLPADQESYTTNALGHFKTKTDRNGSVHTYSYDVLGRFTKDAVTTLGAGVNGQVRRLEVAYDTGGRTFLYTSYDAANAGNIVNQVQRVFNGLYQLTAEYQAHAGVVNISTTPVVQYAYSFVSSSGGPNHSRLISLTYPNSRVVSYNYNTGLDDRLNRLSSLSDPSATLEAYTYLGLRIVVRRSRPQPGVDLTYIKQTGEPNGDAGDQYTGLDRFGRVVDQRWLKTSDGSHTDRFQYSYDRDGNRLYRDNKVNASFGELYHANGANQGYDLLNQLTAFARGVLSASQMGGMLDTIASPVHSQSWAYDAVGNWNSFTSDSNTETRTHNRQNQVATTTAPYQLTYDNNGNTTRDEKGTTYVYDAWNRLAQATAGSNNVSYSYDALGRRIIINPGTPRDLYYSSTWQVLEEQVGGVMQLQYLWSPVYIDALIERDTNSGQRLYVQQDANWNVTAILDSTGAVQERYVYDPYGRFTDPTGQTAAVLAPDWSVRGSTLFGWIYLHQGGRYDSTTGLYEFRSRDYSPTLGRWMEEISIQAGDGDTNPYEYENDDPPSLSNPLADAFFVEPVTGTIGGVTVTTTTTGGGVIATLGPPGIAVAAGVGLGWGLSKTPPFKAAGGWIGDTIADWLYGDQLKEAAKPIVRTKPWPEPWPWPKPEPKPDRPRPPKTDDEDKPCHCWVRYCDGTEQNRGSFKSEESCKELARQIGAVKWWCASSPYSPFPRPAD
jgi:RHS repeat-associated protein